MMQSTAVVTQQKSDNKRRKQQGKDVEEEWTWEGKEGRKWKIESNEIENNKR